jgi:hypothetical protein
VEKIPFAKESRSDEMGHGYGENKGFNASAWSSFQQNLWLTLNNEK